jgi:hypothetical protein
MSPMRVLMGGNHQPGQIVFLTVGNKNLIINRSKVQRRILYHPFENGGGIKVRESRVCPSRKEAEAVILNRKK